MTFEPSGLKVKVNLESGQTILDSTRIVGLPISSECGGRGTCGKCQVVIHPSPSPTESDQKHLTSEQITDGFRLACQHVSDNVRVILPNSLVDVKILTDGVVSDTSRIMDLGLDGKTGVAIDIGTTTLVAYLLDLETGIQLEQVATLNPQVVFGEDIMSRLTYAVKEDEGINILREKVIEKINELISTLCETSGTSTRQIARVAVVGNTAMHHLFLGLDLTTLVKAPYNPSMYDALTTEASKYGLKNISSAELYCAPNIAGFVGGDNVAFILSQRFDMLEGTALGIDIGTNGEIVLSVSGELYCCSAAAGSAFEGATISHGMRGQEGAIEHVRIHDRNQRPEIVTIGNAPPRGICGSGIVDLVAELRKTEILDSNGRLGESKRVITDPTIGLSYIIVNEDELGSDRKILFTQKDVRQVQLAKSAVYTGSQILMQEANVKITDLKTLFLAGAFGNYLNPRSAIDIGLLPNISEELVISVGNAAGEGAKILLLSSERRKLVEKLVNTVHYVELANHEGFSKAFINALTF